MKKIINAPENYVDDMLKGICAATAEQKKKTVRQQSSQAEVLVIFLCSWVMQAMD